ncbi:hypothetical protein MEO42_23885 [Dolichospermum sp. ST_sed6]|nr:hypothetical protein [Dolichospermum sp. ST_sed6]MDD1457712.1 hypothetical protein [Dolichospermum sp. ST_sed7]
MRYDQNKLLLTPEWAQTHYPLPITHYPLPITHYPLPITYGTTGKSGFYRD